MAMFILYGLSQDFKCTIRLADKYAPREHSCIWVAVADLTYGWKRRYDFVLYGTFMAEIVPWRGG